MAGRAWKILAVLFFAVSLAAYLADQAIHRHAVLTWYDLNVYNDAGLITRQLPSILYTWELKVGVQFTYTPFAALIFAGGSYLPMTVLRWLMTDASLVAIPLTAWLTLGALGRRGTGRLAVALAVSAVALWTEPVVKALFLGQIEPLLMLLVVWDLTRPDSRKWKGMGIGVAAGIKLVPLIFIPYLLLAGKFRQAAVAAGTFAATLAIGFAALPGPSGSYWLTGYFMRPRRTGSVHSLVNQSLLGMLDRSYGSVGQAQGAWLALSLAVAAVGLVAGAMLSRTGRPVQGWTLVGITGVLVSPISWDHHWIWIVPFLALLAGLAMTARPLARAGYVLTIIVSAGVIGSWPWRYSGARAYVPRRGLLGWFVRPPKTTQIMVVHGWQLLTWNLFVAVGSLIYLALIVTAVASWRKRERPAGAAKNERQKRHERPKQPVEIAAARSSIEALLLRADATLRGDRRAGEPGPDGQLCQGVGVGENGVSGRNGQTAGHALADGRAAVAATWRAASDHRADGSASRPGAGSQRPAR